MERNGKQRGGRKGFMIKDFVCMYGGCQIVTRHGSSGHPEPREILPGLSPMETFKGTISQTI